MKPGRRDGADFQAFLDQNIEEALRYVLGESGRQMVLSIHPLNTISSDPGKFHDAMKAIFQESGAAVIEREIGRRLLETAAKERTGGSARSVWFAPELRTKSSRRVSESQKKVLRRFATLASISQEDKGEPRSREPEENRKRGPLDLTSVRFAAAFKKVS